MRSVTKLDVYLQDRRVGTLAQADERVAFEYDAEWLIDGYSISPLTLPLERRLFMPKYRPFEGLFGVFDDSLPDGWGRLLLDRLLKSKGEDPSALGPLDRLALVGATGAGALEYRPSREIESAQVDRTFDELARECQKIFDDDRSDDLDCLYRLGGSSGGARPKALVNRDGVDWIVKFPTTIEGPHAGKMEYDYALCAQECNVCMPHAQLFPSKLCDGYFGVRRFDRNAAGPSPKVHMVSAGGLLEVSHRVPSLDYTDLMKLTSILTGDYSQLQQLYRLMCFNVFAHNRDDHAKNFSFLRNEGVWSLSPAYDLTYSNSIGGEHATTVANEGARPGLENLLDVARSADIDATWARNTAVAIQETVQSMLGRYLQQA